MRAAEDMTMRRGGVRQPGDARLHASNVEQLERCMRRGDERECEEIYYFCCCCEYPPLVAPVLLIGGRTLLGA
jgi:hypothetical protein